jgi:hypothetical protein
MTTKSLHMDNTIDHNANSNVNNATQVVHYSGFNNRYHNHHYYCDLNYHYHYHYHYYH